MKKLFTKIYQVVTVIILFVGAALQANAQYTLHTKTTDLWVSAVTSDANGDVFVVEAITEAGFSDYGQVIEYAANGTSGTIYNGSTHLIPLTNCDGGQDAGAQGIAVTANGDVYVTTANDPGGSCTPWGNIIKIPCTTLNTTGVNIYGAPGAFLNGNSNIGLFSTLAVDSGNNLYCYLYDVSGNSGKATINGLNGSYEVEKFPANTSGVPQTSTMTRIAGVDALKLNVTGWNASDIYNTPTGLAVDPSGNVYVADSFDEQGGTDGGKVYKITPAGSASLFTSGQYTSALGTDGSGNLYAINAPGDASGNHLLLVQYKGASTQTNSTGTTNNTLYSTFGDGGPLLWWPNTIAAINSANIYVDNGSTGGSNNGDLDQVTGPTINSITATDAYTKASSETFTVTFSVAITGVSASNFSLSTSGVSGASIGTPTTSNNITWSVPVNTGSGDGTLGLNLANSTGMQYGLSTTLPFTGGTTIVDKTAPTIFISAPSQSSIIDGAGSVTYTVTYNDVNFASSSLGLPNITLNKGGVSANGTVGLSGSGTSYTVTISSITGSGTLGISIAAGTALDKAGNSAAASAASTTFTVLMPTITGPGGTVAVPNTPETLAGQQTSFIITGSNLLTNVTATAPTNFQVSADNSSWGSTATITESGGGITGSNVYVRLTGGGSLGTQSGSVQLTSTNATTVNQAVSGMVTQPAIGIPGGTVTVTATPQGTAGAGTSFNITGSNLLGNITATAPTNMQVSADNSTWGTTATITVSGQTLASTPVYVRLSGTGTVGTISGNVQLTSTDATTVNQAVSGSLTTPGTTISLLTAATSLTNSSTVNYTATFAASVTGLSAIDFSVTAGGSVSGASVGTVTGSGTSWTIPVNTGSGDGTVQLVMNSSGGVSPSVTNLNFSGTTVTIDKTAPTVSIGSPNVTYANSSTPISWLVTWSDANLNTSSISTSGVSGNINKTLSAAISGSINTLAGTGLSSRTIQFVNVTGDGTIGFTVPAGSATDNAGNSATASSPSATVIIDNTPPTVTIGAPSKTLTNTGPVTYDVSYSDANFSSSSLSSSNVSLNSSGGASASVAVTKNSATDYTVTLSSITGNGTLGITIGAGTAIDLAGNMALASLPSTTFTVDNTPPSITSFTPTTPSNTNPTNASTITYTITFSEPVTGVTAVSFPLLEVTGGVGYSTVIVTPVSSSVYTITLGGITGNGVIELGFNNGGGNVTDLAGNLAPNYLYAAAYTIDQTPPTVSSITATTPSNANPTNATSVSYTVTFSEPVTGVSNIGFMATTTNTVASTGIAVTPVSSSVYSVTVSGISGDGTLRLDLNNGNTGIFDLAGNPISGGFTGDVYNIDNTAPALSGGLNYASSNTRFNYAKIGDVITLTFGTNEPIQTPTVSIAGHSITATNTGGNNYSASYAMTAGDTEGRIPFNLTVTDIAGNSLNETDVVAGDDITFDMTPPAVFISAPSVTSIGTGGAGTVTYTVTYADANFNTSNLTNAGITLTKTGTAAGTYNVTGSGTSYTVTISNITGLGTLSISVGAGNASDLAGNTDAGAGPSATFIVASTDATLASLSLSSGTLSPAFSPGGASYTANVPYSVSSITVTATPNDPNASSVTTMVNGSPAPGSAPLNVGSNTVVVTVIAQDGTTTGSYTVTVNRAASVNANLARLTLTRGVTVPGFTPSVTHYTVTVESNVTTETITATASDPNATITLNGAPITSGNPSGPFTLSLGDNVFTLVVTAQNHTTKTYTLTVTQVLSSDAYLSNLAIRDNDKVNADLVPLSPVFSFLNMTYTATVPSSQTSVTVKPTSIDPNAVVTVDNAIVATKTFSNPIMLHTGSNTITILVTAQDGTPQTYTVTVTRLPSNETYLSNLAVNTAALSPAFAYNTYSYTASVPNSTSSVTVTANVLQPDATFTVNEAPGTPQVASASIPLTVGTTTIPIVVTAQDNSTTQTYTIVITRAAGGADSYNPGISVTKPTESLSIAEDGILVHQGISPNGDGINDFLQIDNISQYPDNKLSIMNRNGQLVYEAKGYDNSSKLFDGHSNKNGQMQLPGTYFYQLDYTVAGITKHKTGFIVLKY